MVFVTENIMNVSGNTSGDGMEDGTSRPGRGANEQEGNWDNIWK